MQIDLFRTGRLAMTLHVRAAGIECPIEISDLTTDQRFVLWLTSCISDCDFSFALRQIEISIAHKQLYLQPREPRFKSLHKCCSFEPLADRWSAGNSECPGCTFFARCNPTLKCRRCLLNTFSVGQEIPAEIGEIVSAEMAF